MKGRTSAARALAATAASTTRSTRRLIASFYVRRLHRARSDPSPQPLVHLFVKDAGVLGVEDPLVFLGPDQKAAGDAEALQERPHFQGVVERDAVVLLADGEEHRGLELVGVAGRILGAPDLVLLPYRAASDHLAMEDDVGGRPLRLEVHEAGVADQG